MWDNDDIETGTCINRWSCFTDHGYGDIGLMMWAHVCEHDVGLTHSKTMLGLLFCMCHQLLLSVIPTASLDLRSPLFLTVCNGASWGY
jgi:hypothetical protein